MPHSMAHMPHTRMHGACATHNTHTAAQPRPSNDISSAANDPRGVSAVIMATPSSGAAWLVGTGLVALILLAVLRKSGITRDGRALRWAAPAVAPTMLPSMLVADTKLGNHQTHCPWSGTACSSSRPARSSLPGSSSASASLAARRLSCTSPACPRGS